jgi:hypothetical protein
MTAAEVRFRDKALVFPFIRDIEAEGDHVAQVLVVPLAVAVSFASHLLVSHFIVLLHRKHCMSTIKPYAVRRARFMLFGEYISRAFFRRGRDNPLRRPGGCGSLGPRDRRQ